MTKSALLPPLVLLLLPLASTAAAHGDIPPREIDTRAVLDGNSLTLLDYGAANGLFEDANGRDSRLPVIPLYEGGHDLMALDLREAYGPDAAGGLTPGLYARLTFRRGDPGESGIRDIISYTVNGTERALELSTPDNVAYSSTTFTWVSDRLEPGAYEFAVEGFAPYAAVGGAPGDALEGLRVTSHVGEAATDVMPGTYYFQGQYLPDEGQAPAPDNGPLRYALAGPAPLLALASDATAPGLEANASADLRLTTALGTLDQFVTVTVEAPPGVEALLDASQVKLGNASREATLRLTLGPHVPAQAATLVVTASSDLGGFARVEVPLASVGADAGAGGHDDPTGGQDGHAAGHSGGDPDPHDHDESQDAPAPPVAPLAAALLWAALRRRA